MRVGPHLQAVIDRDEDEALVGERLRLMLHVFLVARMPTDAVNPDGDRTSLTFGWCFHVESAALVLRPGIGKITVDLRLGSQERGGREEHGEENNGTHRGRSRGCKEFGLIILIHPNARPDQKRLLSASS